MFVAQITVPSNDGQHNKLYQALQARFPLYVFSILMGPRPCIIAKAAPETVRSPEDEPNEVEMLQLIVTDLLLELLAQEED